MDFTKEKFKHLDQFFTKNPDICLRSMNLLDEKEVSTLCFDRLKKHKDELMNLLKAWQRLLKILPESQNEVTIIKNLLNKNLHSAVQIASIPKKHFLKEYGHLFNDLEEANTMYQNAQMVRSQIAVKYMRLKQNQEPHIKATRFRQQI
ncbi:hypothetical protein SH1V18_21050 [Vallitalea longa]|uniref:Uncharacterized protein n=1 Tax=Vallitalea longa TaxID=2936439 RepID=A0A9W6DEK8_9FIRM|nr:hypothetical protein [Vallitalea longa]GKX29625.1 hypothetical protein SH1V18_21050 [Vallitalea longa]